MIWLAVALGGAIGAMCRYAISLLLPSQIGEFPWATFLVNITGSLCIGFCYVLLIEKGIISIQWRPFLMVGLLGALTTFSTFSLDTILLWQQGNASLALLYIASSVVACVAATMFSIQVAEKLF